MAVRGRKPKPARLRLIEGSRGKVLNARQPKPPPELPSCPSHLLPTAKAEWKRVAKELYDLGIISHLDRAALAVYCQAYGRWVGARRATETPYSQGGIGLNPSRTRGSLSPASTHTLVKSCYPTLSAL